MTVLMRLVCLAVLGGGVWIAYSVVRYSLPQSDIDRALNHPRDGEPREVACPVHGRLTTAWNRRDAEQLLHIHHEVLHHGGNR